MIPGAPGTGRSGRAADPESSAAGPRPDGWLCPRCAATDGGRPREDCRFDTVEEWAEHMRGVHGVEGPI